MKSKVFFLIAAVLVFACGNAFGQKGQAKFGYVNSVQILQEMPEYQQANQQLLGYQQELNALYTEEYQAFQQKQTDFNNNQGNMSDMQKELRLKSLAEDQVKLQEKQSEYQKMLETKRTEFYQPILAKLDQAIKDVAKENGFTYIFDSSSGSLLYAPDGDDITDILRSKLGIQTAPAGK